MPHACFSPSSAAASPAIRRDRPQRLSKLLNQPSISSLQAITMRRACLSKGGLPIAFQPMIPLAPDVSGAPLRQNVLLLSPAALLSCSVLVRGRKVARGEGERRRFRVFNKAEL
ncbi:unnamed protein product [Linum trigynum]|uniref:Uncharacterized protein n=1 Tax=Linum trigynum TaxID=586398 RepID=A0AAV2D812_9ROSI